MRDLHQGGSSPTMGARSLQVRRVLRELYGTLEQQGRGPRWYLTEAEVTRVAAEAKQRGWR